MEKQFPKGFLTKVVNFQLNKFYSVSMKPKFTLNIKSLEDKQIQIEAECSGELQNRKQYYQSLLKKLFLKSKLVDLDGYLFNPFEINNLSNELSMMPTFKYKLESMFDNFRVSVRNTILFCPNKSLYDIVMQMIEKGIRETHIRKILIGQRIKLNYPGWYRYFKITKFIEGETLENYQMDVDGRKVKLYDYFTQKYPYLEVKHKN